jgi:hypothetical protein
MKLGNQTGLPSDLTRSIGAPSSHNGFSRRREMDDIAGFNNDPLASNNRMTSSSLTSNSVARVLIGANPRRNYLLIQNNGTVPIYVGFGTTPNINGNSSLILAPNTGITFDAGIAPNNDVSIVSSADCLVCVIEGSRA